MLMNLMTQFTLAMAALSMVECWELYSRHGGGLMVTCKTDIDCGSTAHGQSCLWLYEGCNNGQCMCDPGKNMQLQNGKCIQIKRGSEQCRPHDVCRDGMACYDGRCRCKVGAMTPDRLHCLHKKQKMLGQACSPSTDTCLQIAKNGYTQNEVDCTSVGKCECTDGAKIDGSTCRNWKQNERGCSKFYHCEGGAICDNHYCVCPTGYSSAAGGTKCVKRDAVRDLPVEAECDEINEQRYCAHGLVCHRCTASSAYHCVRFIMQREMSALYSSAAHSIRPRTILSRFSSQTFFVALVITMIYPTLVSTR